MKKLHLFRALVAGCVSSRGASLNPPGAFALANNQLPDPRADELMALRAENAALKGQLEARLKTDKVIAAKMTAGLSRTQAERVIRDQARYDARRKQTAAAPRKAR